MRVWLVERDHGDRNLVSLVYATPDGERALRQERALETLARVPVTAAREVDAERLEPVADDAERERYAAEAARMRERHDPDEAV